MAKIILIRHGESIWNLENKFTGWIDVPLSENGIKQAKMAGVKLKNYKFDIAFTSDLIRAQQTLFEILNKNINCSNYLRVHKTNNWYENYSKEENNSLLKIYVSDKLNERYYGDLQGLNKKETIEKYGEEQVKLWRRSFDITPPNGESLEMTSKRTIPYFINNIETELKKGKTIIVSAHGNSLRSIIMHIEKISPQEIINFELQTAIPHIYEFDEKLNLISKKILT